MADLRPLHLRVQPGDVLVVRITGRAWTTRVAGWAIRAGAWLTGQPTGWNHVIIAHHWADGVFYGVQGQPGVVGWVDMAPWLADGTVTIANDGQPKTDAQRKVVCDGAEALVGRAHYDWAAIGVDAVIAADVLRKVNPLWQMAGRWGKSMPGHVVCSSAADYLNELAGLDSPRPDRWCTPADWAEWIQDRWGKP